MTGKRRRKENSFYLLQLPRGRTHGAKLHQTKEGKEGQGKTMSPSGGDQLERDVRIGYRGR